MLTERRIVRTDETAGILVMILTEEFAVGLGSCFFSGKKATVPCLVTSNRYIPVKNQLDRNTVVFCACEMIQLYSVVFYTVRDAYKFQFRFFL